MDGVNKSFSEQDPHDSLEDHYIGLIAIPVPAPLLAMPGHDSAALICVIKRTAQVIMSGIPTVRSLILSPRAIQAMHTASLSKKDITSLYMTPWLLTAP